MSGVTELWFVRLADGRVVRVKSTRALRYHLRTGRIPATSLFRRAAFEDWEPLEAFPDLADLVQNNGKSSPEKVRPQEATEEVQELHVSGARGLVGELLAALDSCLNRTKVRFVAVLSLFLGLMAPLPELLGYLSPPWSTALPIAAGLAMLFLTCLVASLISQLTVIEVGRQRQARRREILVGLGKFTFRLALGWALVGGIVLGLVAALRQLPDWLATGPGQTSFPEWAAAAFVAVRTFLEVLSWPILVLALLLAPILVVEECSLLQALGHWWRLLRQHLARTLVYEGLAVIIGVLIALPFVLPVVIASWASPLHGGLVETVRLVTLSGLGGLALTPLLTYLLVANVFIYLNLRYEYSAR